MSYFKEHYGDFRYPMSAESIPGFRAAQLGAIHAIGGHFGQRSEPAIITMPTGSGKTAVMIASAFVLRPKRVLVITPSRLVREQITEQFETLTLLQRLRAIPEGIAKPKVRSISTRLKHPADWQALYEFDVVVGTTQSISPGLADVSQPPSDLFDLILIDEAHHSSAVTWQAVLDEFPTAQRILFTATPFRRDGREIKGRFVFTYDLQRAYDDGVYGNIAYSPVESSTLTNRDIAVAQATERHFCADRVAGLAHLIMVRTDSKQRAAELEDIYCQHTRLRLASLNSSHSLRHAKAVLRRLDLSELDGIIAVNMLGEGFDMPRLKEPFAEPWMLDSLWASG